MVTPDGQRTMGTFLGASVEVGPEDLDEGLLASSSVLLVEAYFLDRPAPARALREAVRIARTAGRRVAMTLSDPACVDRHRDDLLGLLSGVDLVFANETEVAGLYRNGDARDAAIQLGRQVATSVVTLGAQGCLVTEGGSSTHVPACPAKVVDTTGAGDAFAAGFLFGYSAGREPVECGRLGAAAAAQAVSQWGARLPAGLRIAA
jgi:sugar/nucleoside kinase (ribokinase family)